MLRSRRPPSTGFIEPCLPSNAPRPPVGDQWLHEVTQDGYRMMAGETPPAPACSRATATTGPAGFRRSPPRARSVVRLPQVALLGPCVMSHLSPQSGSKRTFDQAALIWRRVSRRPASLASRARSPSARVIVSGGAMHLETTRRRMAYKHFAKMRPGRPSSALGRVPSIRTRHD
jgi:hypothetical protein